MNTNLFRYLFRGMFSVCILTILTITSFAQLEPTENFNYLNYFSNAKSGNSTFKSPYILVEHNELSDKSLTNEKKKTKKAFSISNLEKVAFDLMNEKRAAIGLKPVIWNEQIAQVARLHSQSMAKHKYFSHQGIDGLWIADRANDNGLKKWRAIGENIAYNRGYDNPGEFVVERWMKSTSHRENALNTRWEESGVGVAIGADGETVYFTQVFLEKR